MPCGWCCKGPQHGTGLRGPERGGAIEKDVFVKEGQGQVGPGEKYFVFVDGDYLGGLLIDHFGLPKSATTRSCD